MLIRPADLARIRAGSVDLAFRRWGRARVRIATLMRTSVGLVEVTELDRVDDLTDTEAHRAGLSSREEVLRLMAAQEPKPIWRIGLRFAGEDPRVALRADDDLDTQTLVELRTRLDRLDHASPRGPWTQAVLALIAARPAVRAPDLALSLGRDTATFKRDVRKLKELGLTESLDVGYRISPRGAALLSRIGKSL